MIEVSFMALLPLLLLALSSLFLTSFLCRLRYILAILLNFPVHSSLLLLFALLTLLEGILNPAVGDITCLVRGVLPGLMARFLPEGPGLVPRLVGPGLVPRLVGPGLVPRLLVLPGLVPRLFIGPGLVARLAAAADAVEEELDEDEELLEEPLFMLRFWVEVLCLIGSLEDPPPGEEILLVEPGDIKRECLLLLACDPAEPLRCLMGVPPSSHKETRMFFSS